MPRLTDDQPTEPLPPPQEPIRISLSFVIAILTTLLAVLVGYYLWRSTGSPRIGAAVQKTRSAIAIVMSDIERGDSTFKDKQYSIALNHYTEAAKRLDDLVKFESESPKANDDALQHYYNIQVILRTKARIAEIGLETSTL